MRRSKLADKYLLNLKGIEIGGSAHNAFGLNTINVDYVKGITRFKEEEIQRTGTYMKVDVVASADKLPFENESYDFIINSHVLEHMYDPISTIKEWLRVIKKGGYLFMIIPHKERTFDKDRQITSVPELIKRQGIKLENDDHSHHCVWNTESFLYLCDYMKLNVIEYQDIDDKAGNGFAVLIKKL